MASEKDTRESILVSAEAGEFSWSFTRHRIFNFCKRAYFYRYYAALKGWDKFADPRSQLLYRLKNLIKAENWTRNAVSKSLENALLCGDKKRGRDFPLRDFFSGLQKFFFAGKADIEDRRWEEDPKRLNLFETYYGESSDNVFGKIKADMNDIVSKLSQSGLVSELASVPYLQWKLFKPPFVFPVNGLNIWTAPDFIWSEKGKINILFLRLGKNAEDDNSWKLPFSVCAMIVENKFHTPASKIVSRIFFCGKHDEKPEIAEISDDAGKLRSVIAESSSRMLSMLPPDGKIYEENFDRNESNCAYCEFKEYCSSETKPSESNS